MWENFILNLDFFQEYNDLVKRELLSERQQVNFLTADGVKFAHPLHHLGKSKEDLPLIAVDSFRHMYLFPKYEDSRQQVVGRFLKDFYAWEKRPCACNTCTAESCF